MPELQHGSNILDIGCGNGRDALFFSQHGHNVVGIDASKAGISVALENCRNHGFTANFQTCKIFMIQEVISVSSNITGECFAAIYARFFLHAIHDSGNVVLENCKSVHQKKWESLCRGAYRE